MLKCYLDRGAKADASDSVMCIASVIFKPTGYKQFVRPWNRMLKTWRASAFHATDFYNGGGEFKRNTPERKRLFEKDSKLIPKMIGERVKRILVVSFKPLEFDQVASPRWKEKFGTSVHSLAIQLCLLSNGMWRDKNCRSESFAYFMETGDPDESEVVNTATRMRNDNETGTGKFIKVSSFTTVDKGVARGLEAADFVAWHWNKYYMDKIRAGNKDNPRRDFAALNYAVGGKMDYIFATANMLKYLFSLVLPDVSENEKQ